MNDLFELTTWALRDTLPPVEPEGAYLFAQTADNELSVFQAAKEIADRKLTAKLLIPDSPGRNGYPGYPLWKVGLERQGVPSQLIIGIPTTEAEYEILNTRTEAEAAVKYSKANGWKRMLIAAAPFHQVRAFMTAVSVALESYPELLLYAYSGPALPWNEEVAHSQGVVRGKRHELLQGELDRLELYRRKGDLASVQTVLHYLRNRDARS